MKKLVIVSVLLLGINILVPAQKLIKFNGNWTIKEIPAKDSSSYQQLNQAVQNIIIYQKLVREKMEISPAFFCGQIQQYGETKFVKDRQTNIKTKKFCRYPSAKALQCAKADFDKLLAECANSRVGYFMLWRKYKALDKLTRAEAKEFQEVEQALRKLYS